MKTNKDICYIYTLSSTKDINHIRYVGKTQRTLERRYKEHIYESQRNKRCFPVHLWIHHHLENGYEILINLIETTTIDKWEEREKYWISYYKNLNHKLTNVCEGGQNIQFKGKKQAKALMTNGEKHKKKLIALTLDGKFFKEYDSSKDAADELHIDKSAITAVANKRVKSSCGLIFVKKEEYNPNNDYSYKKVLKGIPVFRFNLQGELINCYESIKQVFKTEGFSEKGVSTAIRNKTIYRGCFWSDKEIIDISKFIKDKFKYAVYKNNVEVGKFKNQIELGKCINVSDSHFRRLFKKTNIINGFTIDKL